MKIRTFNTTVLAILLSAMTVIPVLGQAKSNNDIKVSKVKKDQVQLFNGKDLKNWVFHLKDPSVDPAGVFTVHNGVILISGNPYGYMRTKEKYSNYRLHVEWRWPTEATNSGVFVNAQLPDTIWPKCIECQLAAGKAGDFICAGGSDMNERSDKSVKSVKKLAASSEKPVGEWNIMEVVCNSNTIEVTVNGVSQNKGTGVLPDEGYICLQSEGKDIQFRNVYLSKLKK
jgi:hypothetical protein